MTIVVIDDDPQARALTVRAIAKGGYRVHSGSSACAAIEFAHTVRDIALIILDLHMPGASGYDALEVLKADPVLKDIPVVMLSATADIQSERERAINKGAVTMLGHPLSDESLLEVVKSAVGRRRPATDRAP
jgi:putative two-component system response regulator